MTSERLMLYRRMQKARGMRFQLQLRGFGVRWIAFLRFLPTRTELVDIDHAGFQ